MYKSSQFVFKLASVSFLYGFLRDEKRHCIIPLPRFRKSYGHVTLMLRIRRADLVPQVSPTVGLGKEHTVNYGSLVYMLRHGPSVRSDGSLPYPSRCTNCTST